MPRTLPLNRRTTLTVVVPNGPLPPSLRHTNAGRVWGGICERDGCGLVAGGGAGGAGGGGGGGGGGRGGRGWGRTNVEFSAAIGVHIPTGPNPPTSAAATTRGRAGKEVVVGGDERKFYTDDSGVVFAALHAGLLEWDKVKEWRRVEVFGASDGRVHVQGPGEDVGLVLRVYQHTPSGRFYGGPGANGIVSSSWRWSHEGCTYEVRRALPLLLLFVDHN